MTSVSVKLNCSVVSKDAVKGCPDISSVSVTAPPVGLVQEDIISGLLQTAQHGNYICCNSKLFTTVSVGCQMPQDSQPVINLISLIVKSGEVSKKQSERIDQLKWSTCKRAFQNSAKLSELAGFIVTRKGFGQKRHTVIRSYSA